MIGRVGWRRKCSDLRVNDHPFAVPAGENVCVAEPARERVAIQSAADDGIPACDAGVRPELQHAVIGNDEGFERFLMICRGGDESVAPQQQTLSRHVLEVGGQEAADYPSIVM